MSRTLRAGDWVPVPHDSAFVFAELQFELSLLGRLAKLAYRIPAGYLELRRATGPVERRRLIFETSANGILVQPFAASLPDLKALFEGREGDRVVALRIVGEAARYYRPNISLRWLTAASL